LVFQSIFFVRTPEQWNELIAQNPFSQAAEKDPGHLLAMVLRATPSPEDVAALQAAISGPELLRVIGASAYISYPAGIGRSKLTGALIEKKLRTRGTARNWNTVLKLAALARPSVNRDA